MVSFKCKLIFVLLLFLMVDISSGGEAPKVDWEKTFVGQGDDRAVSIQQTSDGGYIVAGWTTSYGAGSYDAWLIKTDANGNEQWSKTFGGKGDDMVMSVQQTSDGGYVLAGMTNSYGAGLFDAWLIKTDVKGNELWNKTFGWSNQDSALSVLQTSDGGYLIRGKTDGYYGKGYDYAFFIKTDANGNKQWIKEFPWKDRFIYSVQQASDGGYVLVGFKLQDAWLIKTDSDFNEQWNKTFREKGYGVGTSVQQTSDGGYVLAGAIKSIEAGDTDAWLIKTDENGNEQWNRTFGGTRYDDAWSVQILDDGYIFAGYTNLDRWPDTGDVRLIKTDAKGNEQWSKTFEDRLVTIYPTSLQKTSDGGLVLAGYINSSGVVSGSGAWNIKVDARIIKVSGISMSIPTITKTPITSGIFTTSVKIYNEKGKETSEVHVGDAITLQFMLTNPIGSGNFVFISNSSLKSISIEPKNLIDRKNPTVTEYVVDEGAIPKSREESFKIMQELMSLPTVASSILTGNIPITYIVSKGYGIADMCTSPGCMVWAYSKGLKNRDRFLAANEIYEVIRKEGEGGGDGWIIPPGTTMVISANMTMPLVQQSIEPEVSINYRYVEMGTEPTNYAGWVQTNLFGQLDKHPTMNQDFVATASKKIDVISKEKNIIDQIFEFFKNLFGW